MNNTNAPVICILGMHRSGTSMITGVLQKCGLNLGLPEEMYPVLKGNEKGHFENTRFMDINIKILNYYQPSQPDWCATPNFPQNWYRSLKIKSIRKEAKILISDFDNRYPIWGWKGPRTCVTLPFWQHLLGNRLKYIILLRHPLDIAQSLYDRDKYPIEKGLLLWNRYISDALKYTDGLDRTIIVSKQIFLNQDKIVTKLLDFIDNKNLKYTATNKKEIKNFISAKLWHHNHTKPLCNTDDVYYQTKIRKYYQETIDYLNTIFDSKIANMEKNIENISISSASQITKLELEITKLKSSKYYRFLVWKYKLLKSIFN